MIHHLCLLRHRCWESFLPAGDPAWLVQLQAFGIFAAGYLARPLGGIVMAHFATRWAQAHVHAVHLPDGAVDAGHLLPAELRHHRLCRPGAAAADAVLQGAAIGGEVPGAWVFVSEHVPSRHVGLACGILTCGLTAGILLGSLVATATNTIFTPADILAYGVADSIPAGRRVRLHLGLSAPLAAGDPGVQEMKARRELAADFAAEGGAASPRPGVLISMLLTWVLTGASSW